MKVARCRLLHRQNRNDFFSILRAEVEKMLEEGHRVVNEHGKAW
jgi:hypothetical protein